MKLSHRLLSLFLLNLVGVFAIKSVSFSQTAPQKQNAGFSIDHIDTSVKPQDDFYRFASGNWLKNAVIPDDNVRVDSFTFVEDIRDQQVFDIITQASKQSGKMPKGSNTQLVGDFYLSGTNTQLINQKGITPLKPILDKIQAISTTDQIISNLADQLMMGNVPVLGIFVFSDLKDIKNNALFATTGGTQTREFYLNDVYQEVRKAYVKHIAKMLTLAGENPSTAQTQAEKILQLETTLAQNTLPDEAKADTNVIYNKMPLSQLKADTPNINWDLLIATVGLSEITDTSDIIVTELKYLIKVNQLLTQIPLEDWKTYLRWQILRYSANYLSEDFVQESFNFNSQILLGTKERKPRDSEVATLVRTSLAHPTSQLYVEKYFSPETKAKTLEMVKNIQAEFKLRLQENTWMTEATRQKALDKLDKVRFYIGYPDTWIDYSTVEIKPDDYLGNMLRINQFNARRAFAKYGKPYVNEPFTGKATVTEVNAQYTMNTNAIEIAAAILQPPFFDPTIDPAVNYCSMGAVIAHEFTHGFDSMGRLYDADGNLKDWWTAEDAQRFQEKADRLVAQYNQYEVLPGLFINGQLSLGENIADLGGINIAYSALQRSLTEEEKTTQIDGYTASQRCFLAWAQLWKSEWRPEFLRQAVLGDPHPPGQFRVKGSLTNAPDFFPAFEIKKGDPLWSEPVDQIKIW